MQVSRYTGCRGFPPVGNRRHSGGAAACGLDQGCVPRSAKGVEVCGRYVAKDVLYYPPANV
eukprot:11179840-Lingulodinium_polyedra.AAC.1